MTDKTIYALGFFDGVHRAHTALLRACRALARENGARAGVVTFLGHPDALTGVGAPGLITTSDERERLLRHAGMECVRALPFNAELQHTDWRDFLDKLVRDDAAGFVCGDDFRFGYRGAGTAETLEGYCRERSLPCAVVPEQRVNGVRVSSTHIRALLAQGNMREAAAFLGHPYTLSGVVAPGQHLGRRLGFPTANLAFPDELARPRFGVYACRAHAAGGVYDAVTNLGVRPTVGGEGIRAESWLLNYAGDLYGQPLRLEFVDFIRPEQKFPDLEAMRAEVLRNADRAREILRGD